MFLPRVFHQPKISALLNKLTPVLLAAALTGLASCVHVNMTSSVKARIAGRAEAGYQPSAGSRPALDQFVQKLEDFGFMGFHALPPSAYPKGGSQIMVRLSWLDRDHPHVLMVQGAANLRARAAAQRAVEQAAGQMHITQLPPDIQEDFVRIEVVAYDFGN